MLGCPTLDFGVRSLVVSGSKSTQFGSKFSVGCQTGYYFAMEEYANVTGGQQEPVEVECLLGGKWNIKRIPKCSGNMSYQNGDFVFLLQNSDNN